MEPMKSIAEAQCTVTKFFQDISRVMESVEQQMLDNSFAPVGNAAVFQDVSQAFDRGLRWTPSYVARAYVKGKKPTKAVGYCIHFGPYSDPACAAFLEKSKLSLPFVSLACLRGMQPGPLEIDRRQIWDRLWDSGRWATYEDQVNGPLRIYTTTKEISGFQAKILGALTELSHLESTDAAVERITTPLLTLYDNKDKDLLHLTYLLAQE
jgi:hypothetical protein